MIGSVVSAGGQYPPFRAVPASIVAPLFRGILYGGSRVALSLAHGGLVPEPGVSFSDG